MKALIDRNNIDLAIVGESMAGKTTWITNLFNEKLNVSLRNKCLENNEGQTKIMTCYKLIDNNIDDIYDIYVDYIEFISEKLESLDIKKLQNHPYVSIIEKAKIILEQSLEQFNDFIRVDLSENKVDIEAFFNNIINSKSMADIGIIHCVCICAPANEQVYNIMKNIGAKTVTIRDTRGLMDETEKFKTDRNKLYKTEKHLNENEDDDTKSAILSLLAERGVLNADACVFITQGGNALNKEENHKRYGFLFETIVNSMPTFLIGRSPLLTDKMESMEKNKENFSLEDYREWMKFNEKHRFQGPLRNENVCYDFIKILEKSGMFSNLKGLKNILIKKHYNQLLIPNIFIEDDNQETIERYVLTVMYSFTVIISETYNYKSELYELIEKNDQLPDKLKKAFEEGFKIQFEKSIVKGNDGKKDTKILKKWYVEDVAQKCVGEYYDGLVGKRGGLTTYIPGEGYKGRFAIELLESAYKQFDSLIDSFVEEFEKIQLEGSSYNSDEEKVKICEYLTWLLKQYTCSYSCTNNMIQKEFLYVAWKRLHNIRNICECLEEDKYNEIALNIVKSVLISIITGVFDKASENGNEIDLLN